MAERGSRLQAVNLLRCLIAGYRRLPLKPLRGVVSRLYAAYRRARRNRVVTTTVAGITYRLDLREMIDSALYFEGCFEPHVTALLQRFVTERMTVFDIGANVGCHALLMAKLVGPTGRVIAIEPTSFAFAKLTENSRLNQLPSLTIENVALSDVTQAGQTVRFKSSWKIGETNPTENIGTDVVDFIRLDDYVAGNQIAKIDFIKLDVDGFEYKVLTGARRSLENFHPVILMELAPAWIAGVGDSAEAVVELLADLGYEFYSETDLVKYASQPELLAAARQQKAINVLLKFRGTAW